jgi:hypothetical protein
MKEAKDLTVHDLTSEGRRWVYYPGEQDEFGVRAEMVFEDHPFRFLLGQRSNDPFTPAPRYLSGKDPMQDAIERSLRTRQIESSEDWHAIVASSIRAQVQYRRIQVTRDPASDECRLLDGYGNQMSLSGSDAERLYQDLGKAYSLPYRESCSACGAMLNSDDECEFCDQ